MTLTTEQLRARAESLGLDFFIELRAGIWVKEWLNDGCTSATAEEVMMWSMLANREAQPVGFRYRHNDTVSWLYNDWRWPDSVEAEQCQIEWLYTAPPAPAVPDGFKLVPTVPTTEMIAAAMNCDDVTFINLEDFCVNFGNIYAAMLAAAPEASHDNS
ncbi:hypothetical protein [Serratia surfactantfaciens]|uniref:hypothetical protein n=1 Tax=Serratia surfactantfaciens TaxID=2741499 RepID=UPI001B3C8F4C|nr:hypothetical protein [Serratia surfactantfaciens]